MVADVRELAHEEMVARPTTEARCVNRRPAGAAAGSPTRQIRNPAPTALHRRPWMPPPGPFADTNERLPQAPEVAAQRRTARRRATERKRACRERRHRRIGWAKGRRGRLGVVIRSSGAPTLPAPSKLTSTESCAQSGVPFRTIVHEDGTIERWQQPELPAWEVPKRNPHERRPRAPQWKPAGTAETGSQAAQQQQVAAESQKWMNWVDQRIKAHFEQRIQHAVARRTSGMASGVVLSSKRPPNSLRVSVPLLAS
jgi:hypothetical protein